MSASGMERDKRMVRREPLRDEIAAEMDRVYGALAEGHPGAKAVAASKMPELIYHKGPPIQPPDKPHTPPLGVDMVLLPKHYSRYEIEPVRFIVTNKLDWFQGNIVKYICRAPFKHDDKGQEDVRKVVRYAMMYAKFLAGSPAWWTQYKNLALQGLIEDELTDGTTPAT